jgi:hypothetical protein
VSTQPSPEISSPQRADAEALLARLQGLPRNEDDCIDGAQAAQQFGLDAGTLTAMRDAGLSLPGRDGEDLYFYGAAYYLGLYLGLARRHLWAIEQWRRALERFSRAPTTRIRVAYLPQLPEEPGEVPGRVVLPGGTTQDAGLQNMRAAAEFDATMRAEWPTVPADVAAVLDEVAALELCPLPPGLRRDTEVALQAGFADCLTAARLVVDGCRAAGHAARIAHGLLVGLPFSTMHTWAEVELDCVWTPVDPLTLATMHRFTRLDREQWPAHRSLGPLLARVVDAPSPVSLVRRDGEHVAATFLTRIVSA